MLKLNIKERRTIIRKIPGNKNVPSITEDLKSDNGLIRQKARGKIVAMGSKGIDLISGLLYLPDKKLHWEAVKALGEIAHPNAAPFLIRALSDHDTDIRWLAAEGLIAIGKNAFRPILEELIKNPKSIMLRKGAHHVFYELSKQYDLTQFNNLLSALNSFDAEIHTPIEAMRALDSLRRMNL